MIFTGTYENKVDAKGRVSVPAPFRALISGSASRELALFPSFRFSCLEGMSFDTLTALSQQAGVSQVNLFEASRPNRFSLLFRSTQRLHIDDAGRVSLPDSLITQAGLSKTAVFTGEGHSFLLWSPEAHAAQVQADMAALAAESEADLSVDFALVAKEAGQATDKGGRA